MTRSRLIPVLTFALGLAAGSVVGEASVPAARVTGIGGVFFKADDPEALRAWYGEHLGIEADEYGSSFMWRDSADPDRRGRTVWNLFPRGSDYFGPGDQQFMVNYRVDDLAALLAELESKGVNPVADVEEYEFGRFAWILDGEGNRVELWEPRGE